MLKSGCYVDGALCATNSQATETGSKKETDGAKGDEQPGHAEEMESDDEQQSRKPRLPTDPGRPTQKEIDEHNATHVVFRSCCPHCVRGKAVTSPHYAKSKSSESEEERSGVTTVSLDYCFLAGS